MALLDSAMRAAWTWGSFTFGVHTAHRSLHRRLRSRLGAVETGVVVRLANGPPVASELRETLIDAGT